MKKSLLIAAMMALALTACKFGKNTPGGTKVVAEATAKSEGKSPTEIEAVGRKAYEDAGGYAEEMRSYEQFKGKKGIKKPKKPSWYKDPASTPAKAEMKEVVKPAMEAAKVEAKK